jgi:small-conductance mechanosensitive channel
LPYYAPKFFSKDLVVTGFTGKVEQISLMYTFIKTDEGILLKIPNDVVIKSAVLVHNAFESIVVRTKFEVPRSIKPDLLFSSLSKNLIDLDFIIGEPQYRVLDITPASYIALVEIVAKGDSEESQRSKILQIAMRTLDSLIKKS